MLIFFSFGRCICVSKKWSERGERNVASMSKALSFLWTSSHFKRVNFCSSCKCVLFAYERLEVKKQRKFWSPWRISNKLMESEFWFYIEQNRSDMKNRRFLGVLEVLTGSCNFIESGSRNQNSDSIPLIWMVQGFQNFLYFSLPWTVIDFCSFEFHGNQ